MTEVSTSLVEPRRALVPLETFEVEFELPAVARHRGLLTHLRHTVGEQLDETLVPIRLAVTSLSESGYGCEVGVIAGLARSHPVRARSLFDLRRRKVEDTSSFTTVFVVPTGIGCSIGGHAGDATPAAQLLASVSDTLVTHPNVVNASDVNEQPSNALYVEGSVLARLLMGTVGLAPVRSNRVLVVADAHPDSLFSDQLLNAVNAARSSFGLRCPQVVLLDPPLPVESVYAPSGRAAGRVRDLERLFDVLDRHLADYDAVALSTQISVDPEIRLGYYGSDGDVLNPWGGVEAMLTHAVSALYDVPAAHSPMLESRQVAALALGVVDPRMAAEVISVTFFISVLKGLQRSPHIIASAAPGPGILTVENVSCLVIPAGALGIPTLAALEQGIPVIAVRENTNVMNNDLRTLPWRDGQFHTVDNYWEAAGVVASLRAGIDPGAVRRPLTKVPVATPDTVSSA